MAKKLNKRGYPQQHRILFEADNALKKTLLELQKFYSLKTRNKVFPHIIVHSVLDIAVLKEDPKWTSRQLKAWRYCQNQADKLVQACMLIGAKKVLSKKKKSGTMTISQLAVESISECMPRDKLQEYAESKGIDCTRLRKSGIIKRIKALQKS